MQYDLNRTNSHTTKICILVLCVLFVSMISSASVSGNSPNAGKSEWTISISGLDGLVCVGEPYMLTAKWDSTGDTLSSLSGPGPISVSAKLGEMDPSTQRPGTNSGTAYFVYTAQKEGYETVTVKLFNTDLEVDTQSTANFEVEKCNYRYDLNIHSYYFGDVLDMEVVIKSSGLLTVPDPSHPRQAEGFMKRVTYDGSFTRFPPECTLSTYNTDHANGLVDVKTVETGEMGGVTLVIGTPEEFTDVHSVVITCDGQSHPQVLSIPVNITEDPWISEKFSTGEGTKMIDVPFIQGGIDALTGFNSFYFAILSLTREAAK
jgi:hypothetical protein